MKTKALLPFPNSLSLYVFSDDGNWDSYGSWFKRPWKEMASLVRARIILGHREGSAEPDYSVEEWERKAEQLVQQFPNCVFVFGSYSVSEPFRPATKTRRGNDESIN